MKCGKILGSLCVFSMIFISTGCNHSDTGLVSGSSEARVEGGGWFPGGNAPGGNAVNDQSGTWYTCNEEIQQNPVDENVLNTIQDQFTEGVRVSDEWLQKAELSNMVLTSNSNIKVTFISEGTDLKDLLGYFLFKDNNNDGVIQDEEVLGNCVVFRHASKNGGGDNLAAGDSVDIGHFPAGTGIGFYLIVNGPGRDAKNTFSTASTLNPDNLVHAAVYPVEGGLVIGMEDELDQGDGDFNDVIFRVQGVPASAIPGIESEEEPEPEGEGNGENEEQENDSGQEGSEEDSETGTGGEGEAGNPETGEETPPVQEALPLELLSHRFSHDPASLKLAFELSLSREAQVRITPWHNGIQLPLIEGHGASVSAIFDSALSGDVFQLDVEAIASDGASANGSYITLVESGTGENYDDSEGLY